MADVPREDRAAFERIASLLEAAWNAGDGEAFAAPFANDADFVTIRGEHFRGRPAIGAGHAAIFKTIYAGSTNHLSVEAARLLRPDVALVHVHSRLDAPRGPLAGRHGARFTPGADEGAGWLGDRRVAQYGRGRLNPGAGTPVVLSQSFRL